MDYSFAKVSREGHMTTVTMDRPDQRNALHSDACFELAAIFDDFEADPEQWVAILTGTGDKAFCAGADLKGGIREMPPSGFAGLCTRFSLTKPVIAAVNGFALGGGFETALACDVIVAADTSSFGLTEPRGRPGGAGRRAPAAGSRDRLQARHGHPADRPARACR